MFNFTNERGKGPYFNEERRKKGESQEKYLENNLIAIITQTFFIRLKKLMNKAFGFSISKILPLYGLVFTVIFWAVGFQVYYYPDVDRKQMC